MTDLDRLTQAIADGDLSRVSAAMVKSALGRHCFPLIHSVVAMGSVDAALALKDALLPGAHWSIEESDDLGHCAAVMLNGWHYGDNASPARALLLATLRAYAATQEPTP